VRPFTACGSGKTTAVFAKSWFLRRASYLYDECWVVRAAPVGRPSYQVEGSRAMRERFGCAEGDHLCMRQFRGCPFQVQSVCVDWAIRSQQQPWKLGGVEVHNLPRAACKFGLRSNVEATLPDSHSRECFLQGH